MRPVTLFYYDETNDETSHRHECVIKKYTEVVTIIVVGLAMKQRLNDDQRTKTFATV